MSGEGRQKRREGKRKEADSRSSSIGWVIAYMSFSLVHVREERDFLWLYQIYRVEGHQAARKGYE